MANFLGFKSTVEMVLATQRLMPINVDKGVGVLMDESFAVEILLHLVLLLHWILHLDARPLACRNGDFKVLFRQIERLPKIFPLE